MTNLELMLEAEKGLSLDEKRKMEDYFVGALSVLVDEKAWRRALESALRDHNRRKEATKCA